MKVRVDLKFVQFCIDKEVDDTGRTHTYLYGLDKAGVIWCGRPVGGGDWEMVDTQEEFVTEERHVGELIAAGHTVDVVEE